jgi:hypothetical protein
MYPDIGRSGQVAYLRADPMKILAVVGGLFCALFLCLFIWNIHPYSFGPWRMEEAALWAALFFAPMLVLFWAVIAINRWQPVTYIWMRRLIQLHAISAVFFALVGCTARQLPPVWLLYGVVAFGAVFVDLIVLGVAPWSNSAPEDIATYRRAQLKIAGGTVAAIIIWSFLNIGLVVGQAQFIAGGHPYCIHVADDYLGRYRPIRSLMDLNGLKMHTPFINEAGSNNHQPAFHALLVVERGTGLEWRHWSYSQQRFVPFKPNSWTARAQQSCEPRVGFAPKLPLW